MFKISGFVQELSTCWRAQLRSLLPTKKIVLTCVIELVTAANFRHPT